MLSLLRQWAGVAILAWFFWPPGEACRYWWYCWSWRSSDPAQVLPFYVHSGRTYPQPRIPFQEVITVSAWTSSASVRPHPHQAEKAARESGRWPGALSTLSACSSPEFHKVCFVSLKPVFDLQKNTVFYDIITLLILDLDLLNLSWGPNPESHS